MVNSYTLYRGIVIGIAGLLALFLTILFVVKGTAMFPATAALPGRCSPISPSISASSTRFSRIARQRTDLARRHGGGLSATFVIFLYAYLNLNRWHGHYSHGALSGSAAFCDCRRRRHRPRRRRHLPPLARRHSDHGLALIIYARHPRLRPRDHADPKLGDGANLARRPWMAVTGMIDNDIVQPALGGGLSSSSS